ncbi:hypothetical protein TIFTF001_009728 [Ficus carica]|uniref:Uncharacterized protein n=1 Tax=Ficus carica TaxID=3494 RepID=A0AA87ZV66_FICCA|nr:hypothetical protein TIFTF001_009728 [Ficus carica]
MVISLSYLFTGEKVAPFGDDDRENATAVLSSRSLFASGSQSRRPEQRWRWLGRDKTHNVLRFLQNSRDLGWQIAVGEVPIYRVCRRWRRRRRQERKVCRDFTAPEKCDFVGHCSGQRDGMFGDDLQRWR